MKKKIQKGNKVEQITINSHVIRTSEDQSDSSNPKIYAFYEDYHDSSYIESHDTRRTVSLKEHGESRKYSLHNDIEKELVVYKIDDGILKGKEAGDNKCDYGIYTENELLILIELKGGDYKKAIQQITNTTQLLGLNGTNKIKRLLARAVLSNGRKVPNVTESDLARLKHLISKYNGGIKDEYIQKSTQELKDTLSKI